VLISRCTAFGVYEAYYIEALGSSPSAVAWIGSFQLWLQFTMGLAVGKLFDEGYGRILFIVGSIIYTFSYVLFRLHNREQFLIHLQNIHDQLVQGILAGLPRAGSGRRHWSRHHVLAHPWSHPPLVPAQACTCYWYRRVGLQCWWHLLP
jgi:hypothetical protein